MVIVPSGADSSVNDFWTQLPMVFPAWKQELDAVNENFGIFISKFGERQRRGGVESLELVSGVLEREPFERAKVDETVAVVVQVEDGDATQFVCVESVRVHDALGSDLEVLGDSFALGRRAEIGPIEHCILLIDVRQLVEAA